MIKDGNSHYHKLNSQKSFEIEREIKEEKEDLFYDFTDKLMYRTKANKAIKNEDSLQLKRSERLLPSIRSFLPLFNAELTRRNMTSFCAKAFVYAILKFIKKTYIALSFMMLVGVACRYIGPIILGELIGLIKADSNDPEEITDIVLKGYIFTLVLIIAKIIEAIIISQTDFALAKLTIRSEGLLSYILYKKALMVVNNHSASALNEILDKKSNKDNKVEDERNKEEKKDDIKEEGNEVATEISNLLSVDVDNIAGVFRCSIDIWGLPISVSVAVILLFMQVSVSITLGLGVIVILMTSSYFISKKMGSLEMIQLKYKDSRIKTLVQALQSMRTVKFYSIENQIMNKVAKTRKLEFKQIARMQYLDAILLVFWSCTPALVCFSTIWLFIMLKNDLTSESIFTVIALVNSLVFPLNAFPWVLSRIINSKISFDRFSRFLQIENSNKAQLNEGLVFGYENGVENNVRSSLADHYYNNAIEIKGYDFEWHISDPGDKRDKKVLKNINFEVKKGEFMIVFGRIGAGKTALLLAILDEFRKTSTSHDSEFRINGSIAYVAQSTWLRNQTIKDNILFGYPYKEKRYKKVLQYTKLNDDLETMPKKDLSLVDFGAANLSGGQKQRVSIARALYSNADIYLFDDCLSALDIYVGKWVFEHAINGYLRKKGKTIVLVANNLSFLEYADSVTKVDRGELTKIEKNNKEFDNIVNAYFEDINQKNILNIDDGTFLSPFNQENNVIIETNGRNKSNFSESSSHNSIEMQAVRKISVAESVKSNQEEIDKYEESMESGYIKLSILVKYIRSIGWITFVFIMITYYAASVFEHGVNLYISVWMKDRESKRGEKTLEQLHEEDMVHLYVLSIIVLLCIILTNIRAFAIVYGGLKAAKKYHNKLLDNVMYAPMSFHDATPTGVLNNRFGKDVSSIDERLPSMANVFIWCFITFLNNLIIMCYGSPFSNIAIAPVFIYFIFILVKYTRASRAIKRLESINVSPVLNLVMETMNGNITIRAFGKSEEFMIEFLNKLSDRINSMYSAYSLEEWFALRLQLIGVVIISASSLIFSISIHLQDKDAMSLLGLSLTYSMYFCWDLFGTVYYYSLTEKEFISAERINQFFELPKDQCLMSIIQENESPVVSDAIDKPSMDENDEFIIKFENIVFRYKETSNPALNGFSLKIRTNEKIGICGRTGSGKSSIINILFRAYEYQEGELYINGKNAKKIENLRKEIAIIPQDPLLFEGTIKENLDLEGNFTDSHVLDVINSLDLMEEEAHLSDRAPQEGNFEFLFDMKFQVQNDGGNLSAGQKQIVQFIRALLRGKDIICLDEATANLDSRTEYLIQKLIRTKMQDKTMLVIAHKIKTIEDFDRVILMENGKIAEEGDPKVLSKREDSKFYALIKEFDK